VTDIDAGMESEAWQNLTFFVTAVPGLENELLNTKIFSSDPEIDVTTGNLTFHMNLYYFGPVTFHIILQDDGGTGTDPCVGRGSNSSNQTFTVVVEAVNQEPSFELPNATLELLEGESRTVLAFAVRLSFSSRRGRAALSA
jgi:hypothetical protein